MKIQKQSKKVGLPHPEVAALINTLIAKPENELAGYISSIKIWTWPRSDLHSWTKVLNRFDAIFSDLIDKYDINKLQLVKFDEADKKLLLELLRFERMLLENSTNRKLFASYDRLNALLATSDLDVLVAVLQLLLRPSQQYSSQPPTPHSLNISAPRLQALALRWPGLREAGIELHELLDKPASPLPVVAKAKTPDTSIRFGFGTPSSGFATPTQVATGTSTPRAGPSSKVVSGSGEVTFQFYRKSSSAQGQESKPEAPNVEQTPTRPSGSRSSSNPFSPSKDAPSQTGRQTGMTVVRLTDLHNSLKDDMEIVSEAVQKYDIPEEEVFELMCRVRIARVLGPGREAAREKVACARLLAIAIFAHTQSESAAQQQLFLYEPDLTQHIAELIHHDRNVPIQVQIAAVNALDGIARYRHRSTEVLAAVNANVSHGILMGALRKAVEEISKPPSTMPNEFPEALLGFITYLASQSAGGTQVVGAGLVPQLILLVENRLPERMTVVSKAMPLIDNLLYGFPTAFQLFVNAHGVEAMVERILHEVTTGVEKYGSQAKSTTPNAGISSLLPFVNSSLLKHIIRSMHRMMQSSGTAEGLRTLIDSSLVKSIKLIMESKLLFGPPIYSIAINIMAMFVHNEPTSLAILQEAHVPDVFYGAIESGIEPAIEVITSVPNAIGALCLNQTGLNQFNEHKSVMPTFFSMFTSEPHIKVLLEKDNANAIGGAVDELVRHHPSLKDVVFESITGTLQKIEDLGRAFQIPKDQENLYRMISTSSPSPVASQEQPVASTSSSAWLSVGGQESTVASGAVTPAVVEPDEAEPAKVERGDNVIASHIDILCRFLDGMFQHIPHCQEFVENTDGLDRLGRLYALPCLPIGYGSSLAADSMVQLLRSMTEVSATRTLETLTKHVQQSLEETKAFWEEPSDNSRLAELMDRAINGDLDQANSEYRKLFTLHLRVNLLADIYTTVGYSHSRGGPPLIQTLTGPDSGDILPKLGALHRAFVWEHAALKSALAAQGVQKENTTPAAESEELLSLNRPQDGTPYHEASANDASASGNGGVRSVKSVNEQNSHLMRHLAEMLPSALAPFFHAVVKVLAPSRRIPDPDHRKQGFAAALVVANILKDHLTWRPSSDLHATYAYATVMLNLLQILIFDERQPSAMQIVLLIAFFRVDGQERVAELINNCLNAADRIFAIPEQEQTQEQKNELIYVLGCAKIAFGLLQSLVSSSPLFESPQTSQLITHDKTPNDEDYFEPHHFLIRCRATFMPVASRLWNAPWLPKTIPDLIKGVVNTVLEIMKGDREEAPPTDPSPTAFSEFLRTRAFMQPPPPRPVDESRVQVLVDMGFSREAATRALIIGGNNTARATDYLLTHPEAAEATEPAEAAEPVEAAEPAEAAEPTEAAEAEGSSSEPAAAAPEASSSMQTDEPASETPEPVNEESKPEKGKEKAHENEVVVRDWVKELHDARQALRPDIGPRLLALADKDPQLVFDLKSAFVGSSNSYQASCLDSLFDSLKALTPSDSTFATRCRLLAVVLNAASGDDYVPPAEKVHGLIEHLLSLSVKPLEGHAEWLAAYLLVIEMLLVISDEIAPAQVPKDDDPVPTIALRHGDGLVAPRKKAFDLCLELLPLSTLTNDDLLAVFRLLILLTRDHNLAAEFLSNGGLQHLLAVFNDSSREVGIGQTHSLIILRHIIETPTVLKQIMASEVKKAFPNNRNRPLEVPAFVSACRASALRNPEEFLATAKELCELTTAPRPGSSHQFITINSSAASHAADQASEGTSGSKAVHDFDERLIQYLVNELHRAGRSALDALSEDTPAPSTKAPQAETSMAVDEARATTPTPTTGAAQSTEPTTTAPHADYLYACFLLQSLAELLLSYPSCKLAFIAAGKKKMSTPSREGKSKSTILSFLLSDLLSFGKIYGQPTEKAKRRIVMSKCVMEVVFALCTSPLSQQAPSDLKDLPSDIVHVRKTVLEVLAKSIKDTSSITPIDVRYARLVAHAELCSLLLTPQPTLTTKPVQDDVTIHLAKIMLEKNFVGILTGVVGEVDLNYPNVKSLVSAVLRPLEYLSKVAIKMGRSDKSKTSLAPDEVSETSSSMSVDEDEEEESEVEAANDLYRNSALGMFSGEMDEQQYVQDEEMDDSEEEGEEVEMEFGDEDTGTDASDQTSDDEDDINAEGELAIADAEDWEDEDEEMTDADDDDDDSDDSEDDAGLTWADDGPPGNVIAAEPGPDGELEREMDDMEAVDLQAALEDDGDDAEPTSDDEDNALEQVDAIPVGDEDLALDWEGQQPGMHIHNGRGFFMATDDGHRRLLDDGDAIFARARGVPGAASLGVTSHPLLENPESSRANNQSASRSRRSTRGGPPAVRGAFNEMLQVIDNMIGGDGAQLMQQILAQHPVPPGSTLDITTNATGGGTAIMASLHTQPANRHSSRHDRHAAETREVPDFPPMPTSHRWQDESSITQHRFTNDRVRKISDHLVIALLPAFREKVRQEKEAEKERAEKEKVEREREEAERLAREKEEAERLAKEQEEAEKAKSATPEPVPEAEPAAGPSTAEPPTPHDAPDVVMEETESKDAAETAGPEPPSAPQMDVDPQPSGSGSGEPAIDLETPVEPPPEAPRVIVHIHGNEVDITDTGIDPTFLEALPDDMREEVLNQHVREQRTAAAIQPRLEETQISADFLDALPPDIRAEILMQESAEQARLERARARAAEQSVPAGPSDIDPASFLASLDPQLRQAVLMEQEEGFLQTLPSAMIAEATAMRETYSGRRYMANTSRGATSGGRHDPPAPRKPAPPRDSIQLLDKTGISSLVRLLFFPQFPPRKNNLHKILVNLCENSKTREDLFVLLLGILQDGTADVATVDQSFSQMSVAKASTSPTKSIKSSSASQEPNPLFAHLNGENIPNLVAQRCLDTLGLIVQANERSPLYFLTEHELPAGMKRASSRKGKGKEKHAPQTHFPVVQLLSLLDRPNILNSPAMLDAIASLLAAVTKPLTSLKAPPTEPPAPTDTTDTAASSTPAPTAAPTTAENKEQSSEAPKEPAEETPDSILRSHPPQIPHHNFRLIVNILTAGEVSGKTFTNTLLQIQHVSALPGARDVIAAELKSKAQEYGMILYNDLDDLAKALEEAEASKDVRGPAIAKFSSASSDQAKLLRILKMIDLMYAPKEGQEASSETNTDEEKVTAIYEDFRFQGLWRRLGDCLAVVEQKPDLEHIATVLLPLIEALMVVCKHVKPQSTAGRSQRVLMSPLSPSTPRVSMSDLFVEFTDAHRKVLNLMVRNNPSLMGGSFSLLVQNPRVLDFDNKRNWFNQQLRKRSRDVPHGTLQLNLRRPHVFEDSFQNLQRKTGDQIKYGKLSVRFYNEEGVDAGGVTREWFQILARQMFNPDYALFQPCAADKLTFQPNRASMVNPEHLSFFKFVGRVIGKAIYDGRLMDAHFARSLYRQILGKPVDYRDVEWVDPDYYKSLCWILENDPTMLEMTFTVEADEFGVHKVVPLKENGEKTMVTDENKKEFVQLSAQYRLITSIKDQIEALLAGFYDIIPKELISIFNEQELELLISGTPDIDIDEWRAATDYNGYSPSDPAIVWWWRALKSFDREERAKVLSFATGTSRVPLDGFGDLQGVQGTQRFSIHRAYGDSDRLPQAHTCFNQIDLPQYSSYEKLRTQLLLAINEGGEGFGFA